jgi:hypothetical protein
MVVELLVLVLLLTSPRAAKGAATADPAERNENNSLRFSWSILERLGEEPSSETCYSHMGLGYICTCFSMSDSRSYLRIPSLGSSLGA